MKHILILGGLLAATAFAQDATAPRAPFIARKLLTATSLANPDFPTQLPAIPPALSEAPVRDAFVKMGTVENSMATLENRLRLLGAGIDALGDANKRTRQLGVAVEKYARVFVKIGTWSSAVSVTRKPLVILK